MTRKKTIKDHIKTLINKLSYSREKRLEKELSFWKRWIETKGLEWRDDFNFRMNEKSLLLPEISKIVSELNHEKTRILDVGSGPLSRIGYRHPNSEIEINACDPLADKYNQLLDEYKVQGPIRVEQVEGEQLLSHYGQESFHVCTAMNCCLLYTSPSPRDKRQSRMPSSA